MDKAAKAVRRSGVKLLSLSGGHGDLNMMISEQKDVRQTAKAFMKAQHAAAEYHMRWAAFEQNRAIQDTAAHILELNALWTEAQQDFAERLKEYKNMFDRILEGEKLVDQAKTNLGQCESRERKLKKELKRCAKKATPEEIRCLENKLTLAEQSRDLAQLDVIEKMRENEVVKVIRYKAAHQRLSEAYVELGKKCAIIFESQSLVTSEIPDVHDQELEDIKYTGAGTSKMYVQQAKDKLKKYRRQSTLLPESPLHSSFQCSFQEFEDLPPAYSSLDTTPSPVRQPCTRQTQSLGSPQESASIEDLCGAMGGVHIRRETSI